MGLTYAEVRRTKARTEAERAKAKVPEFSDAVEFAAKKLGLAADEKQREVLLWTGKRGILNCTRQWGKSTIAAAKAVHRAYTRPGSLVLVASPTERQSAEFLRKAAAMTQNLGIKPRGDGDNAISLQYPNRSRIVGLPGTEATVRGFSAVSLLLIDEAARVEDVMYKSLRPMLAVGDGDLWLMSTPYGKRGFFYDAWQHGGRTLETSKRAGDGMSAHSTGLSGRRTRTDGTTVVSAGIFMRVRGQRIRRVRPRRGGRSTG